MFMGLAVMALIAQDAGQWQDFGTGSDGVGVSVNLDSIERTNLGTEAMVRWRLARADAQGATQADTLSRFDCTARTVTRLRLVSHNAQGAVTGRDDDGETLASVQAAAGTPIGEVLDAVCSIGGPESG
jgi:hypothetical protein